MPVHGPGVGTGKRTHSRDRAGVASAFSGGRSVAAALTARTLLALAPRLWGLAFAGARLLVLSGGGP